MRGRSYFFLFSGAILLFILFIEKINGRFWLNDFKVYYSAAQAFLSNEPVYGVSFGLDSGVYKYSPILLFLFAPYTLLPYEIAAIVHFLITSFATIIALSLAYRLSSRFWKSEVNQLFLLLAFSFVIILDHLFRELHLGNVNMILVLILLSSLWQLLKHRDLAAGLLFALACLFKPYFILLALPLLLNKKWKMIMVSALGGIALFGMMMLICGVTKTLDLHRDWLTSMSLHSDQLGSNHTLLSLMNRYLHIEISSAFQFLPLLMLAGAYSLFVLWRRMIDIREKSRNESQTIFSFFVLLAIIPNLLITDTEHFLFSLPLIVWCMHRLFILRNKQLTALYSIIIIVYATASSDLYGTAVAGILEHAGLLGLANIALILFSTFLQLDHRKSKITHTPGVIGDKKSIQS